MPVRSRPCPRPYGEFFQDWVAVHAQTAASQLGKPLLVDEFGMRLVGPQQVGRVWGVGGVLG